MYYYWRHLSRGAMQRKCPSNKWKKSIIFLTPSPYLTVTLGLFQSNITHTCTKFCLYLTNISNLCLFQDWGKSFIRSLNDASLHCTRSGHAMIELRLWLNMSHQTAPKTNMFTSAGTKVPAILLKWLHVMFRSNHCDQVTTKNVPMEGIRFWYLHKLELYEISFLSF